MQKIWTEGKGEMIPMKKETMSVTEVMVMETAASLSMWAMRCGTGSIMLVLRQAASITNVSSIPIPVRMYSQIRICKVFYGQCRWVSFFVKFLIEIQLQALTRVHCLLRQMRALVKVMV